MPARHTAFLAAGLCLLGCSKTSGATARVGGCTTRQLAVTVGAPNGAAGSTYYTLTFTNTRSQRCTLTGYPGVSFLDQAHAPIGVPEGRNPSTAPIAVPLTPAGHAYAVLRVVDPDVAVCSSRTPRYVRVFPPDQTSSVDID